MGQPVARGTENWQGLADPAISGRNATEGKEGKTMNATFEIMKVLTQLEKSRFSGTLEFSFRRGRLVDADSTEEPAQKGDKEKKTRVR